MDQALLKLLTDISTTCKVDVPAANVACAQGENRHLIAEFVADQRSRVSAVGTLGYALSTNNPALQVATANLLNGAFRSPWGNDLKAGAVPAPQAKVLLDAALKAPRAVARQALPGAVLASSLAGQQEQLFAQLDSADEAELRPLGYRHVMTHGRLAAFAKIQQLVKGNSSALSFAALEAPRNMYGWTEPEKAAICPWASDLLQDPRPNVATRAAGLLANCSGEFIDSLLSRGERAFKDGALNAGELGAFRDLCSPANQRSAGGATDKQCARNRDLLSDVAESKKLDAQTRSLALASLAYQWPDDKTSKLARALVKDGDKSLADQADRTLKRLEQRKATEQASTAKPPAKPVK